MSAPPALTEIALPDWVGQPLTGAGAAPDTSGSDAAAAGTDVAGTAGDAMGQLAPLFNPLGAYATFLSQREQSIAKSPIVRFGESFLAGLADLAMGGVPGVPKVLQPLVPVVDGLMLGPLSKALGRSLGIADNVNGLLRALAATLDARVPGGGGVESEARGRARAETGAIGELARVLYERWHRKGGTDT